MKAAGLMETAPPAAVAPNTLRSEASKLGAHRRSLKADIVAPLCSGVKEPSKKLADHPVRHIFLFAY
jgi:hypothetical protein